MGPYKYQLNVNPGWDFWVGEVESWLLLLGTTQEEKETRVSSIVPGSFGCFVRGGTLVPTVVLGVL